MFDPSCRSSACAERDCPRSIHRFLGLPGGRYGGCTTHRKCEAFEQVEPVTSLPLEPLTEGERAAIGQRMDRADEVIAATFPEEAAYWTEDADGDPGGPMRSASEVPAPVAVAPEQLDEYCRHTKAEDGLCWVPDCPEGPDSRSAAPPEPAKGGVFVFDVAEAFQRVAHPAAADEGIPTFSVDEIFPTPLESYDAWRCTSCWSRSFKPGRCCKRSMQAIRMVMYAREVPDA